MVSNVVSDPRYVADVEPGGSEICVPILAGETLLGVIDCEDARIGHFDEADLAFLRTVANLIGARLQQIDQREMRDPTASSSDRQLFRERARAREIERLAQIGHVVWSGDGSRTIFCSEELASIHDVTPSFYTNRTKSWEQRLEWIHPEDRARYQGETRARIAEKIGYNIEYRLRSHTGVVRDVREIGEPLFDAGGEVLSISAIVRDNTRQRTTDRALSDTEHLLSQVLTHTREGYWYIDNNGRSIDANPALCALLGLQKANIIGRPIFDFVDKPNARIFESEIAARGSGERGYYELELSRADGTKVPCINSATPIYDDTGQRVGSVGLWTDITALRASQRQSEFSREEAERANRAKSEFLSAMSLELRTSLNTVLGYGQLLGTHPEISSSEQLTGAASQIVDSGRQ
jgi:PAS domain S-box-containing protein